MLGFSLTKLLVLAVIIALVWYGFKWAGRISAQRGGGGGEIPRDDTARAALEDAEDMAKCELCGTFVPAQGATDCGRDNCPYPS
jgi:uncharacterized protein